ncbi:MAG: AAA family ATPase, partial [Pseudomonadota bacterium]
MSAIDQIVKWAQGLPGWQADAVRRLLAQGELTADDRNEIYQMLKVEFGIEAKGAKPEFPKVGGFSGTGQTQDPITIHRISDAQHVNAVENGSSIPFGLTGITVVYGENGSGKSSFARILKRACRARDTKEPIHQNVFDEHEKGPATATIKVSEGDDAGVDIPWTDGVDSDERLASVTLFDSKCARVIVDDNNEAVYIPYGCHVFDGLVELLKSFQARLQNETPKPAEIVSPNIVPGTKADKFLKAISRNTTAKEVFDATAWSEDVETALAKIVDRIAGSKTNESLARSRRLRAIADRVDVLAQSIKSVLAALAQEKVATLNTKRELTIAAESAVKLAAQANLKNEPLPTGASNEWRILYEAARDYSMAIAYPAKDFPQLGEDALCVLCQQDLGGDAQQRMLRFKKFMEDKSEQALSAARSQQHASVDQLRSLSVPRPEDFEDVLGEFPKENGKKIRTTFLLLASERDRIVSDADSGKEVKLKVVFDNHLPLLEKQKDELLKQAKEAEKDANPEELKKLQLQRDELGSRKALHHLKETIEAFIGDKQLEYKFTRCIQNISTRPISQKSKEIISATLSPQLESDLQGELKELGAAHLPLSVKLTGRDGGARHRITLKAVKNVKLSEILSEGEHCVVAVAGFLAELGGAATKSPIVLDDPVSSLDHRYSRFIAMRLVKEAENRQVIVFTHNIAFLVAIQKRCAGIPLTVQTVKRSGSVPGKCMDGVPWEAMEVKDRL